MTWTNDRLGRLLTHYRLRYWPASRRLRSYRVEMRSLDKAFGECDFKRHMLFIDVSRHRSDLDIRSTLLHEMVHAVVGVGRPGHGAPFWTHLESLLARRAPITVGFPELGESGRHLCMIPARFRRCRRMLAPVYRRSQRELKRESNRLNLPEEKVDFERECEDAANEGLSWREVWTNQAILYGLVDMDGRLLAKAKPYRDECRRGYRRGRRLYLSSNRRLKSFSGLARRSR